MHQDIYCIYSKYNELILAEYLYDNLLFTVFSKIAKKIYFNNKLAYKNGCKLKKYIVSYFISDCIQS